MLPCHPTHAVCVCLAVKDGVEPPLAESKSAVLPLHHSTIKNAPFRLPIHAGSFCSESSISETHTVRHSLLKGRKGRGQFFGGFPPGRSAVFPHLPQKVNRRKGKESTLFYFIYIPQNLVFFKYVNTIFSVS